MRNTKRILASFLAFVVSVSTFAITSVNAAGPATDKTQVSVYDPAQTATLSAAVENVITIDSANEFMAFQQALRDNATTAETFSGITIKLNCDIIINQGDVDTWSNPIKWDARGSEWRKRFAGNFDGDGHVISGIYSESNNDCGLFGRVVGGTFKNVSIINSYFKGTGTASGANSVGGLIGYVDDDSKGVSTLIENVYVDAKIETVNTVSVGGIVGKLTRNTPVTIKNCTFVGSIETGTSGQKVGGILGDNAKSSKLTITNCYVNADINAASSIGGIVGIASASFSIKGCSFEGSLSASATGDSLVGGLIGDNNGTAVNSTIEDCSVNAYIKSKGIYVGGLIGRNEMVASCSVSNCIVNADIVAEGNSNNEAYAGGFIGRQNRASLTVQNCIVTGTMKVVSASKNASSFIGYLGTSGSDTATKTVTLKNILLAFDRSTDSAKNLDTVVFRSWANGPLNLNMANVKYDKQLLGDVNDLIQVNGKNTVSDILTTATKFKFVNDEGTAVNNFDLGAAVTGVEHNSLIGQVIFASGWSAVDGDYPVPNQTPDSGATYEPYKPDIKDIAYINYGEPTAMIGYQIGNNGTSVRLLATLTNAKNKDYVAAGFDNIKITHSTKGTVEYSRYYCDYVYESVIGGGITYTADSYLSDNIFCLAFNNLSEGVVTIEATPFVATSETNIEYGDSISWEIELVAKN